MAETSSMALFTSMMLGVLGILAAGPSASVPPWMVVAPLYVLLVWFSVQVPESVLVRGRVEVTGPLMMPLAAPPTWKGRALVERPIVPFKVNETALEIGRA